MSDTPLIDKECEDSGYADTVSVEFARQLERRIAELEAEREKDNARLILAANRIAELEDFKKQAIKNYDQVFRNRDRMELERNEARRQMAALEAERDEGLGRLEDLKKERNHLWVKMDRMRDALVQIQNGEAIGLYGHATDIARAALAGEEKP